MAAPNKARDQLNNLRAEIRSLGRTIAALEAEHTLATVGRLRTLAKSSRTGGGAAARTSR